MSREAHLRSSEHIVARCAIITLSDTRTESSDKSGQRIREMLLQEKHEIKQYHIIPDEPSRLKSLLTEQIGNSEIDAILTNGGTGISRRDQTANVVANLIEQPIPGFGELFRMLSWQEIGSASMLSRAVAGISSGKLIFAMPGSTKAVELAMTRLILPEIKHLISELRK